MQLAAPPAAGEPWKIGWFGALRCRKSLELLAAFTRRMDGRFEVVLRGRPAYSEFDDFDGFVAAEPHVRFAGPYRNPEDLAAIYGEVHFSWAIDFFEEGLNSSWLLPNRLYEGCRFGAVPIAMRQTETGRFLADRHLGLLLDDASAGSAGRCARRSGRRRTTPPSAGRSWRRIAEPGSATAATAARWSTGCRHWPAPPPEPRCCRRPRDGDGDRRDDRTDRRRPGAAWWSSRASTRRATSARCSSS